MIALSNLSALEKLNFDIFSVALSKLKDLIPFLFNIFRCLELVSPVVISTPKYENWFTYSIVTPSYGRGIFLADDLSALNFIALVIDTLTDRLCWMQNILVFISARWIFWSDSDDRGLNLPLRYVGNSLPTRFSKPSWIWLRGLSFSGFHSSCDHNVNALLESMEQTKAQLEEILNTVCRRHYPAQDHDSCQDSPCHLWFCTKTQDKMFSSFGVCILCRSSLYDWKGIMRRTPKQVFTHLIEMPSCHLKFHQ